jgi:hypothetical protein
MVTYIYLIENIEKGTNKVYIGKTISTNVNNRKYTHRQTYGKQIHFTIIDEIDSLIRSDWRWIESYWIEQFKQWGFETINKNKGGGGPEYCNKDTIHKIKNIPGRGLKISLNKKRANKISIALKGIKKSNTHAYNISKGKQGILCPHKWKPIIQCDKKGTYIQEYTSIKQASTILNINYQNLSKHLQGFSKTIGGYTFKYKIE